jgi:hypothetical protein
MGETSECPRCGADVGALELEPHFCSTLWEPPLAELARPDLRWDGAHLVVATDSPIPAGDCWLCGAGGDVPLRRRRFSYAPPWVYLSALGGPFGILLGGLLQRRARFSIPLCTRCELRWDLGTLATLATTVLGLPLYPLAGGVGLRVVLGSDALLAGALLGLVVWVVALVGIRHVVDTRLKVRCVRIADGAATLAFPRPALVRASLGATGGVSAGA